MYDTLVSTRKIGYVSRMTHSMVIISDSGDFAPEAVSGEALNEIRIVGRIRSILIDV